MARGGGLIKKLHYRRIGKLLNRIYFMEILCTTLLQEKSIVCNNKIGIAFKRKKSLISHQSAKFSTFLDDSTQIPPFLRLFSYQFRLSNSGLSNKKKKQVFTLLHIAALCLYDIQSANLVLKKRHVTWIEMLHRFILAYGRWSCFLIIKITKLPIINLLWKV